MKKTVLAILTALVSCQASNNVQSGVSFAGSLRCKKTYVPKAFGMLVFCALTSHKIYDRLTRHLRLDTTLGSISLLAQVTDTGNRVGIGISSPAIKLDFFEPGGSSGNSSALRLRSGNTSTYTGNNQILMSYNSGTLLLTP